MDRRSAESPCRTPRAAPVHQPAQVCCRGNADNVSDQLEQGAAEHVRAEPSAGESAALKGRVAELAKQLANDRLPVEGLRFLQKGGLDDNTFNTFLRHSVRARVQYCNQSLRRLYASPTIDQHKLFLE
jgi:hypothetical protein